MAINTKNRKFLALIIVILLAILSLLYAGYSKVMDTYARIQIQTEQQQLKRAAMSEMYEAARARSVILLQMYAEHDPFELDDLRQELSAEARHFIIGRSRLMELPLSQVEKDILAVQNKRTGENAILQDHVADLLLEGRHEEVYSQLFERAIPEQSDILSLIIRVISSYSDNADAAVYVINDELASTSQYLLWLGLLLIAISVVVIFLFSTRISREDERQLQTNLERQKAFANKLMQSEEQLQKSVATLAYHASHDALTSLSNRREFESRLEALLKEDNRNTSHIVLYLDLDQFKIINDTCGHVAGDELLRQVPEVISSKIRGDDRGTDFLARLGGDEFGIILPSCDMARAKQLAKSIIQAVSEYQFYWKDKVFRIGVSIGIVVIDDTMQIFEDVLKYVDSACYAAKDAGRNRYHVYQVDDQELRQRETEMDALSRIEYALQENSFVLFAQPIVAVSSDSGVLPSCELLIRMKHGENDEIVPPGAFLPAAERYHKMVAIDRWVFAQAIQLLLANPQFLERVNYCSINLSGQSLTDEDFISFLLEKFAKHPALSKKLVIEITETAAIANLSHALATITVLKELGIRFALDDFGSGLSSFGYLKKLPVDFLKIDGMFVKDIIVDPIDKAMVNAINEVGAIMGKDTIAEYVESEEILHSVREIGVTYAQGYGIAMPIPVEEFMSSVVAKA